MTTMEPHQPQQPLHDYDVNAAALAVLGLDPAANAITQPMAAVHEQHTLTPSPTPDRGTAPFDVLTDVLARKGPEIDSRRAGIVSRVGDMAVTAYGLANKAFWAAATKARGLTIRFTPEEGTKTRNGLILGRMAVAAGALTGLAAVYAGAQYGIHTLDPGQHLAAFTDAISKGHAALPTNGLTKHEALASGQVTVSGVVVDHTHAIAVNEHTIVHTGNDFPAQDYEKAALNSGVAPDKAAQVGYTWLKQDAGPSIANGQLEWRMNPNGTESLVVVHDITLDGVHIEAGSTNGADVDRVLAHNSPDGSSHYASSTSNTASKHHTPGSTGNHGNRGGPARHRKPKAILGQRVRALPGTTTPSSTGAPTGQATPKGKAPQISMNGTSPNRLVLDIAEADMAAAGAGIVGIVGNEIRLRVKAKHAAPRHHQAPRTAQPKRSAHTGARHARQKTSTTSPTVPPSSRSPRIRLPNFRRSSSKLQTGSGQTRAATPTPPSPPIPSGQRSWDPRRNVVNTETSGQTPISNPRTPLPEYARPNDELLAELGFSGSNGVEPNSSAPNNTQDNIPRDPGVNNEG